MESHDVSGLKAKQHEIRRRISELEGEIKACRSDLVSISEPLRIFGDPEAYARPEALFGRGDLARIIFDALRRRKIVGGIFAILGIASFVIQILQWSKVI